MCRAIKTSLSNDLTHFQYNFKFSVVVMKCFQVSMLFYSCLTLTLIHCYFLMFFRTFLTMVLPLVFLVYLILLIFVESLTQVPFATLYSGKYCDSESITIEGMYESSLRTIGWDDTAHSVKMLGTWIFYERESFNSFEEGQTIHFIGDNDLCINSTTLQLAGQISSIRYAGLPWSYKDDSINIYEVEDFQGDEIKSEKDLPFVTSQFQAALIITGCSAWTFYDHPSYHGTPVCINATEDGQPVLVRDITDKNIPYDSIRSARIGCYKY